MKTTILRTACFAVIVILMSSFVIKAQNEPFYNTKWENGRVVSKTKFDAGNYGMFEPKWVIKYTYDENGEFQKKEVCVWNPKYDFNDKTGRFVPDYSEKNWTPQYCILQKKDLANNFVIYELHLWDKKINGYDEPEETMIYQIKDSNHFNYLAFTKGSKYDVVANLINYDRELLAGMTK